MALYTPEWVETNIGSFSTLVHTRFEKVPESYDYSAKNNVRSWMVKQAKAWISDQKGNEPGKVRLFFLPHVCAIDLYEFSQAFTVDSAKSLAVEHNHFYAEHLRSWVEAADQLEGGEPFLNLQIFEGKTSEATATVDGKFEIVNLDFQSAWNLEIQQTLKNLFKRGLLTIPGVLFLTVNDSEVVRLGRAVKKTKPLYTLVPQRVYQLTNRTVYTCHFLWYMDWATEGSGRMYVFAFGIHHKEAKPG